MSERKIRFCIRGSGRRSTIHQIFVRKKQTYDFVFGDLDTGAPYLSEKAKSDFVFGDLDTGAPYLSETNKKKKRFCIRGSGHRSTIFARKSKSDFVFGIWTQEHHTCQKKNNKNPILYSGIWTQEHHVCQKKPNK